MATVPASPKIAPAAKYEAQVSAQLALAERRVRKLDLVAGLLGFLAMTLVFALVMVLLHWKLQLSAGVRQLALVLYFLLAAAFLTWQVILPQRRPINPRFAALQLERTLTDPKNSVVNWVDLRDEKLPAAIHGALTRRAAKDARQADVERAFSARQAGWAGGAAGLCGLLFLIAIVTIGWHGFFSALGGVIVPTSPESRVEPVGPLNQIAIRQPEGGNVNVPADSPVTIVARVSGPLSPGDGRLVITYPEMKDTVTRPLSRQRTGDWGTTVTALEVRDGFTYKVIAGDAETPSYQVGVFFTPAITKFEATYHFRSYVGLPRFKVQAENRRLQAWRGSEIQLRVQTNGTVKEAEVELTGKDGTRKTVPCVVDEKDPEAFEARFPLADEGAGTYRVRFTSSRGEKYADPLAYDLIADSDKPPSKVELTKPGQHTSLPANGLLKVEGFAEDDIGVKSLVLQMRVVDPKNGLKGKPYRTDNELRLPGGGYLKKLAYKDAVNLGAVTDSAGKPFALKAGMELEYWLEAGDACDYPGPNPTSKSKHFFVRLTEPESNQTKQKNDRDQAQKEQQDHEKKQDTERAGEDQKRKEEQQKQEESRNGNKPESEPSSKPGGKDETPDKSGRQPGEKRPDDGGENPGENNAGQGSQGTEKKGEAKDDSSHGENKPGPDSKQVKGNAKPEGDKGDKDQGSQGKESAKGGGEAGEGKDSGNGNPMSGSNSGAKPAPEPGMNPLHADAKPGGGKGDSAASHVSESKASAGKGVEAKQGSEAGHAKAGKTEEEKGKRPEARSGGETGQTADKQPAGDAKGATPEKSGSTERATAKDEGKPSGMEKENQGTARDDGTHGKGGPENKGEAKAAPPKGSRTDTAAAPAEPKPEKGVGEDVAKIDPKTASKEDLEKIYKAMRDGKPQDWDDARRKLEEAAKRSDDPKTKELARKMVDDIEKKMEERNQAEQKDTSEVKSGRPPEETTPDTPPEHRSATAKRGPERQKEMPAEKKPGAGAEAPEPTRTRITMTS